MATSSPGTGSIVRSRERDGADAQLVARMAAGDERALGSLYDTYGAAVYGLAMAITRHEATAESVVTDAFAALWREARAFDPARRSVFAWLTASVRALALSSRRAGAMSLEPTVSLATGDSQLGQALARLPAAQRTAVELAYFRGCTRAEIATLMGETDPAVAAHLSAAMESLRSLLPSTAPDRGMGEPFPHRAAGA